MTRVRETEGRRTRRREGGGTTGSTRAPDYKKLRHPFQPQGAFSEDEIESIHMTALRVLEELGIKVLLPEARQIYQKGGAKVDTQTDMVYIGRDVIQEALKTAPNSIKLSTPNPERYQLYELGSMLFIAGAACPQVTDRERGRRPGTLADYIDTVRLQQAYDVIHVLAPAIEPQDSPVARRHYDMTRAQIAISDKPLFAYSRGTPQSIDNFKMVKMAFDLDQEAFEDSVWMTTIINSNSPRQLDIPMAQGIIDHARVKQMSIMTPFCLAGAMAPITQAGALTLQHAEALAGIALAQLTRPGAPISYGGFSSNVDMKSGSPAFGTPEHVKTTLGAGQLARFIGLPWRTGAGSAANISDAQASMETLMGSWAALLANATVTVHSAGWLEGGLAFGYEKYINDIEALQTFAELCVPSPGDDDSIGFDAIAEVQPGGHFFAAAHTMARYSSAFYEPIVADLSNFGTWFEAGGLTSTERATGIWKELLEDFQPAPGCEERAARIDDFIAKRIEAGGAPPES